MADLNDPETRWILESDPQFQRLQQARADIEQSLTGGSFVADLSQEIRQERGEVAEAVKVCIFQTIKRARDYSDWNGADATFVQGDDSLSGNVSIPNDILIMSGYKVGMEHRNGEQISMVEMRSIIDADSELSDLITAVDVDDRPGLGSVNGVPARFRVSFDIPLDKG